MSTTRFLPRGASLSALVLLSLCGGALARSGPEQRSLRPLAMGNAFVAVVDGREALYYNPAGLNLIGTPRGGRNTMSARVNVGTAGPGDGLKVWNYYNEHEKSFGSEEDMMADDDAIEDLTPIAGKAIPVGAMPGIEYTQRNLGVATWLDATAAPYVDVGATPYAGISEITIDAVFQIAGARQVMDPRLSVGVGYRLANRQEVREFEPNRRDFQPEDDGGFFDSPAGKAAMDSVNEKMSNLADPSTYGHGLDVGVLWQQNSWLRLGAAVQNLGMVLNKEMVRPEITLGAAFTPALLSSRGFFARRVNFAVDLEDVLGSERGYRPLSKLNVGAEVEQHVSWYTSVRAGAGLKGGYPSAGAGLSLLRAVHLDAVTWAEEGGYYTGQVEDRFYALQVSVGL